MAEWTDERVELLKQRFASGASASAIAVLLNNTVKANELSFTRNAIIGKVHRLGLRRDKITRIETNRLNGVAVQRRARSADRFKPPASLPPQPGRITAGTSLTVFHPKDPLRVKEVRAAQGRAEFDEAMTKFACEEATDIAAETTDTAVTLIAAKDHQCRWPLGDPADEAFRYCGRPKAANGITAAGKVVLRPYCVDHCRMAYQPSAPRAYGKSFGAVA